MNAIGKQNLYLKEYLYENMIIQIEREEATYLCLNKVFTKIYEMDKNLDNIKTKEDIEEMNKCISKCKELFIEANTTYVEEYEEHFKNELSSLKMELDKNLDRLIVNTRDLRVLNSNYMLYMRKISNFEKKTCDTIEAELITILERFNSKKLELGVKMQIEEASRETKINENIFEVKSVPKNINIYDYKDMIKLAEENNYTYDRSNGDHLIYKNDNSYRIVVIPAHRLGYGLMKKIQKQILSNK